MNDSTTPLSGAAWRRLSARIAALALLLAGAAQAAVPGITGPGFNLSASASSISQPDGAVLYAWGYGCTVVPAGFLPSNPAANCPSMQMPGPTLIVKQGDTVTVTLTNALPLAAGPTSILFPGFAVCTATLNSDGSCTGAPSGSAGVLTQEAASGAAVTYTFVATKPGTYAYYSGTQSDLQIEMGLFGAIVVVPDPASAALPANCVARPSPQGDMRLAVAAYNQADSCYDREYLFQFSEMSSVIHEQVKAQVDACTSAPCAQMLANMEPYRPNYFMINGRSMPDDMDIAYAGAYPNQPYNGNPHMHPGELVLMRVIGQGHWQHPFHFHGNHARVLARDANMLLSQTPGSNKLAGPLLFTIATVSGQTVDAIFTWTGQGLNWDVYGSEPHSCNGKPLPAVAGDPGAQSAGFDPVSHEYCGDHGKPFPVTPPDPSIVVNGQWYGGTPYIGLQSANPTPEAPGTLNQNPQAGYAYMWHSHNEREITTNDVFPGGMMMMLLIDPASWSIDETQ